MARCPPLVTITRLGVSTMSHPSPATVDLPPGPRWPQFAQEVAYVTKSRWLMQALNKRFGTAFSMRLRTFGPTVVISDPALVK